MNSTKKEYIHLDTSNPAKVGQYMALLEQNCNWDLRRYDIYIRHFENNSNYTDVYDKIANKTT